MEETKLVLVYTASGQLQGQMIRIFLESKGITAMVNEEGAGTAFGLGVGPLAEAEILVPEAQAEKARQILDALNRGEYALPETKEGMSDEGSGDEEKPVE
jgi:hypothetical protein